MPIFPRLCRGAEGQRSLSEEFHRIKRLPPYVFAEVNRLKRPPGRAGPISSTSAWATPTCRRRSTSSISLSRRSTSRARIAIRHPRASRAFAKLRRPITSAASREARSPNRDRRDARLERGFRQHRSGDRRAGRHRAGPRTRPTRSIRSASSSRVPPSATCPRATRRFPCAPWSTR